MPDTDITHLLRTADRANLLDNSDITTLIAAAAATNNDTLQRRLVTTVNLAAAHQLQHPFNPPTHTATGLVLGQIIGSSSPFQLDPATLSKHVLAVGQTGAGKTTFFYTLMDRVDTPWWAFDLKQDYRHIASRTNAQVIPWHQLRLNPLRPPVGVAPRRWAQVLADVFGHANALLSASKNYFMAAIMELYDSHDIDTTTPLPPPDTATPAYPTLTDLHNGINDKSVQPYSKTSSYRDTVHNRLDGLLRVTGDILTADYGLRLPAALPQNIVFEFDGLRTDIQDFLMELLFAAVYEYRLANDHRDQPLRHCFFLDEGKRVFSVYKERQDAAGIPHISEVTAKMREFGEALVVADQEPTKLTESLKANTNTKIVLPTASSTQLDNIASSMQLSDRQYQVATTLDVGQAIVQVGNDNPIPVQFPNTPVTKTTATSDLSLDTGTLFPSSTAVESVEAAANTEATADKQVEPVECDLSDNAEWLLTDIARNPFRPITDRYSEGMPSRYKGDKAKAELEDYEFITPHYVQLGRGRMKLFELTTRGRDYLAATDITINRRGRGGIVHQFWQHKVKETVEEHGLTANREQADADVAVTDPDGKRRIAVEVAMGDNERELEHIQKHLDGPFDAVVVACHSHAVRDKLRDRADDRDLLNDRVSLRLVRDFVAPDSLPL